MKKFLTVLLVIAVMFTFSFSTTFAAEDLTETQAISKVTAEMTTAVNDYVKSLGFNADNKLVDDTNVSKTAVQKAAEKVIAEYTGKIATAAETAAATGGWVYADDFAAVNGAWSKASIPTDLMKYAYEVAFDEQKAAAEAAVAAVDLSGYTAADKTTVEEKINAVKAKTQVTEKTEETVGDIVDAVAALKATLETTRTVAQQKEDLAKYQTEQKAAVQKLADTFKAEVKKDLEKAAQGDDPTAVTAANAKLAVLDADVAKVVADYNKKIDAVAITDSVALTAAKSAVDALVNDAKLTFPARAAANPVDTGAFDTKVAGLATKDLLKAYAEKYAAEMKTRYEKDGTLSFEAATVDKQLDVVKKAIDNGDTTLITKAIASYTDVKTAMEKAKKAADTAKDLKTAKETAVSDLPASTGYSGDNKAAVEAIQKEYTDKINAAANKDEVDKLAKEAKAKVDEILTDAQITALEAKVLARAKSLGYVGGEDVTAKVGKGGSLEAYANAKDLAAQGAYSQAKAQALKDAYKVLNDAVLAQQKQNMKDTEIDTILKANYNAAIAKIDAMKSNEAIEAEKKALIEAINALPAEATQANKAQFLAVQKQLDQYVADGGNKGLITNSPKLEASVKKLMAEDKKAAEDKIAALPAKVTVNDKAAIEAAEKAVKEYEDTYKDIAGYTPVTTTALDTAKKALEAANELEVAKLIQAIPANPTKADRAAIEAARKAYDALTDSEKADFIKNNKTVYDKLLAAEKVIAKSPADVESVKITASSKATKGAITVKWTIKGSKSSVKGFQIWRSTKKNTGFKKMFTTKKYSYKNTKGLKKGVTYYYKVRAYSRTEDGKLLFSDWSNKAYRKAK